ncbi:MAG: hypothetical protein RLZZ09_1995, partial [Pseudomonadota bacterium]
HDFGKRVMKEFPILHERDTQSWPCLAELPTHAIQPAVSTNIGAPMPGYLLVTT